MNKLILITLIILNINVVSARTTKVSYSETQTLRTGLIGWWTFDGNRMIQNASDSGGNGYSGMLNGFTSTSTATIPGKIGQALKFDGVDDYVDAGDINAMDGLSAYTICAWVYLNDASVINQTVASKYSAPNGLFFQTVATNRMAFGFNGNNFVYSPNNVLKSRKWQHWCGTFNNALGTNKHRIYLDGQSQVLTNNLNPDNVTNTSTNSVSFQINKLNALNRWLNGAIDDVRVYNRALSSLEIKMIYNIGKDNITSSNTNSSSPLNSGLVGYWTFDGANMKSNVTDSSGSGNNGLLTNFAATSTVVTPGKLGQALKFDGVDDRIIINDMTVLEGSSKVTWSFWLKPDLVSAEKVLIAKWNSNSSETSFLITTGNGSGSKIQIYMNSSSIAGSLSSSVLSVNKWTHVVIVYDGSQATNSTKLSIYIDGTARSLTFNGSIPSTIPATASNMNIGGFSNGGVTIGYTTGVLDDVRVYNRVLSPSEIRQLYYSSRVILKS